MSYLRLSHILGKPLKNGVCFFKMNSIELTVLSEDNFEDRFN